MRRARNVGDPVVETAARAERVMLTFAERVKIHDKLKEVCASTPDANDDGDRIAVYEPGWNDTQVARFVGGRVNPAHVSNLRAEMFGQVRVFAPGKPDRLWVTRVDELEARVARLEAWVRDFGGVI